MFMNNINRFNYCKVIITMLGVLDARCWLKGIYRYFKVNEVYC